MKCPACMPCNEIKGSPHYMGCLKRVPCPEPSQTFVMLHIEM